MPKMPRTLRLDPSDTFVFERAAPPGEWAIAGSILFDAADLETLAPKMRAAFRSGFLGLPSLGFSTLVEVAEIAPEERDRLVADLAERLRTQFGAPGASAAEAAAEEVAFAMSLCEGHAVGTTVAMHRIVEAGAIREQFRTLHRREAGAPGADRLHAFARAFEFVEVEEPEERVDLVRIMDTK